MNRRTRESAALPKVDVISPKLLFEALLAGTAKFGLFVALKASPRSSKWIRSVIGNNLDMPRSRSESPGPRNEFRLAVPKLAVVTGANAEVSNQVAYLPIPFG